MLKRCDIRVRDPFILFEDGLYYMYATSGECTLSCYISNNLEDWEEGGIVFEIPKDFWAYKDVWAAEVHKYNGKYYLFVSLLGKNGLRGTQVAVSDKPNGEFIPLTNNPVTPNDKSCIDGTLFVSDGKPYIFYSRDWPNNYVSEKDAFVGEIWVAELSADLSSIANEPKRLFCSDEAPISQKTPHNIVWEGRKTKRYGSDAPFVQRLPDGELILTWSPYLNDNYVVLGAVSKSGSVYGPWEHFSEPIFSENGGHAMFFDDNCGRRIMCLHAPESNMLERACLFLVKPCQNGIEIVEEL